MKKENQKKRTQVNPQIKKFNKMQNSVLKVCALVVFLAATFSASAQEQSLYAEYMFNGLSINPAYSATDPAAVLTLTDREQWVGLTGAPSTTVVSFYSPVQEGNNLSLGGLVSADRLGVNSTFDADLSAAYRIQLNDEVSMTMGLSIGMRSGISRLQDLGTTTDPLFANTETNLYGSIGMGVMIYADNFYVGISAPQLQGFLIRQGDNGLTNDKYIRHFYVSGGYLINLNRSLDLKPNFLVRYSYGTPVVDLNTNLCINKTLWVGLSCRIQESISFVLQYSVTPKFQLGYAYEYGTSANQQTASTGSHELMLSYRFITTRTQIQSTRWF